MDIVSNDMPNAERERRRLRVANPKRPWRILHVTAESPESRNICVYVGRHPVKKRRKTKSENTTKENDTRNLADIRGLRHA